MSLRTKLFVVSLLLLSTFGIALSVYLETTARRWLHAGREAALLDDARAMSVWITTADANARQFLVARKELRVQWWSANGDLRFDSLPEWDFRADAAELVAARSTGVGTAWRYSPGFASEALHVAVASRAGDVVRLIKPDTHIAAALWHLRRALLTSGLVGLLVAVLMSGLASYWSTAALRRLVGSARDVANGARDVPLVLESDAVELVGLAGSVNKLSSDLDKTIAALRSERDRLQAILESLSDGLLVLDDKRQVTLANPSAAALLGVADLAARDSLVALTREPTWDAIVTQADVDGIAAAEVALPGEGGRRAWARAQRIASASGLVVVMHDVTERRRLETMRADFVANVSHELRTPLSVIRANAETLMEGALLAPEAPAFVGAIARHAERLGRMVAELLDLSRLDAGQYALHVEPTALAAVQTRVAEWVGAMAKAKGVHLTARLDVQVLADGSALERVLLNLLTNAVEHSPEGGTVDVIAQPMGNEVRVAVRDEGPGIDRVHRQRVFERFYRVDRGRARPNGGTGLGLAIVKNLVEAMGGQVGVDAREPRGSVFWVTLPKA